MTVVGGWNSEIVADLFDGCGVRVVTNDPGAIIAAQISNELDVEPAFVAEEVNT